MRELIATAAASGDRGKRRKGPCRRYRQKCSLNASPESAHRAALAGILPAYEGSLAMRRRLAEIDPGNVQWQERCGTHLKSDRR